MLCIRRVGGRGGGQDTMQSLRHIMLYRHTSHEEDILTMYSSVSCEIIWLKMWLLSSVSVAVYFSRMVWGVLMASGRVCSSIKPGTPICLMLVMCAAIQLCKHSQCRSPHPWGAGEGGFTQLLSVIGESSRHIDR